MESCNFKTKFGKVESLEVVIPYKEQPLKFCPQCRNWLFLDDFCKDMYQTDGLKSQCRKCNFANVKNHRRKYGGSGSKYVSKTL